MASHIPRVILTREITAMQEVGEVTTQYLKGLVVMSVHVAHQEVQHGHVHNIKKPTALSVRVYVTDQVAVRLVWREGEGVSVVYGQLTPYNGMDTRGTTATGLHSNFLGLRLHMT